MNDRVPPEMKNPSNWPEPMRVVFQLAEVAVPREVFQGVLDRIGRLWPAPG